MDEQDTLAGSCDEPVQFRTMTREPAPEGSAGATEDLHIDT